MIWCFCNCATQHCQKPQNNNRMKLQLELANYLGKQKRIGQGTVALEMLEDTKLSIDYLFVPIGGGGLAAGVSLVFSQLSSNTKIIGVEPLGAASMKASIENDINTTLDDIDKFIDGAAVKRVGEKTFGSWF